VQLGDTAQGGVAAIKLASGGIEEEEETKTASDRGPSRAAADTNAV
jgi:hypothetical protein